MIVLANKILLGILIILTAGTTLFSVYNTEHNLKIDITKIDTKYYSCINQTSCKLIAKEYFILYNKTKKMMPELTTLKNYYDNKTNRTQELRTVNYKGNISVIFNYTFEGNDINIENFPSNLLVSLYNLTENISFKYALSNFSEDKMQIEYDKNYLYNISGRNYTYKFFTYDVINNSGMITATKSFNPNPVLNFRLFDPIIASGGNVTTIMFNNSNYTVMTFYTNGTFSIISDGSCIEVFMVGGGGGGGGGSTIGGYGGGGAGGVNYTSCYNLSTGNYSVIVGNGGKNPATRVSGGNTSFGNITAIGGGGGGARIGGSIGGLDGGSGGGAASSAGTDAGGFSLGGGYYGGNGSRDVDGQGGGGGGGGANSSGLNGSLDNGGNGGIGFTINITGTNTCYAGGGGGGSGGAGGTVGNATCGGGAGGVNGQPGNNATNGLGGGAGGTGNIGSVTPAYGGSGVVILRYLTDTGIVSFTSGTTTDASQLFVRTTRNILLNITNTAVSFNNVTLYIYNLSILYNYTNTSAVNFSINWTNLPVGTYNISASLFKNNTLLSSTETRFIYVYNITSNFSVSNVGFDNQAVNLTPNINISPNPGITYTYNMTLLFANLSPYLNLTTLNSNTSFYWNSSGTPSGNYSILVYAKDSNNNIVNFTSNSFNVTGSTVSFTLDGSTGSQLYELGTLINVTYSANTAWCLDLNSSNIYWQNYTCGLSGNNTVQLNITHFIKSKFLSTSVIDTSKLLHYWTLNEISTNVTDSVTGVNSSSQTAPNTTGILSFAKSFTYRSATTESIITSESVYGGSISSMGNLTLTFWINTSTTDAQDILKALDPNDVGAPGNGFTNLGVATGGTTYNNSLLFFYHAFGNNPQVYSCGNFSNHTNNWTFVAISYNYNDNTSITCYFNGVAQSGKWVIGFGNNSLYNLNYSLYLGVVNDPPFFAHPVNFSLDEVGVWNTTLSATNISVLYNSGTGTTYPFLNTSGVLVSSALVANNQSIFVQSHHFDEVDNLTINLTGIFSAGSFPTIKVYVGDNLSNDLSIYGIISNGTSTITTFNDTVTFKILNFNTSEIKTVFLKIPKIANVTTASFNISGTFNNDYCYQENALDTGINACYQTNPGLYQPITGSTNITSFYYYINYTKPDFATPLSQWRIYHGNFSSPYNVTLNNQGCWNGSATTLILRFYSNAATGAYNYSSYGECWNSTQWVRITNISQTTGGSSGLCKSSTCTSLGYFPGSGSDNSYSTNAGLKYCNVTTSGWANDSVTLGIGNDVCSGGTLWEESVLWQRNITSNITSVKVGAVFAGSYDWNYTGNFTTANGTNFTAGLISYLATCVPDGSGQCNVPVYISASPGGRINLTNISVSYPTAINPLQLNLSLVRQYLNSSSGVTNIPITIRSTSNGTTQIYGLVYTYAGGNETYQATIHDYTYGSTQTKFINISFSDWNYKLPQLLQYLEFIPGSSNSKNVTPYGQTAIAPILNITNQAYANQWNFSMMANESHACVNITVSTSYNKSLGQLLTANVWRNLYTNNTYPNQTGVWMWADLGCNYSSWSSWNPNYYFKACAVGSVCNPAVS